MLMVTGQSHKCSVAHSLLYFGRHMRITVRITYGVQSYSNTALLSMGALKTHMRYEFGYLH